MSTNNADGGIVIPTMTEHLRWQKIIRTDYSVDARRKNINLTKVCQNCISG